MKCVNGTEAHRSHFLKLTCGSNEDFMPGIVAWCWWAKTGLVFLHGCGFWLVMRLALVAQNNPQLEGNWSFHQPHWASWWPEDCHLFFLSGLSCLGSGSLGSGYFGSIECFVVDQGLPSVLAPRSERVHCPYPTGIWQEGFLDFDGCLTISTPATMLTAGNRPK